MTVETIVSTKCGAHNCKWNCQEYIPGPKQGAYVICDNCTHSAGVHNTSNPKVSEPVLTDSDIVISGSTSNVTSDSVTVSKVSVSAATDDVKAMRAILLARGEKVGARGRLSPAQKDLARKYLAG